MKLLIYLSLIKTEPDKIKFIQIYEKKKHLIINDSGVQYYARDFGDNWGD